jgi:CPA2 family monovalent cation:H+ antiporter-2
VIATQHPIDIRQMADTARKLNPGIEIVVRTHNEDESELLRKDGIGTVFLGVEELARGMIEHIVQRFAPPSTSEHRQAGDSGQA